MLISWLKNPTQFAPMSLSFLLLGLDLTNHFSRNTRALAHAHARMCVPTQAHVLALDEGLKLLFVYSLGLDSTNVFGRNVSDEYTIGK